MKDSPSNTLQDKQDSPKNASLQPTTGSGAIASTATELNTRHVSANSDIPIISQPHSHRVANDPKDSPPAPQFLTRTIAPSPTIPEETNEGGSDTAGPVTPSTSTAQSPPGRGPFWSRNPGSHPTSPQGSLYETSPLTAAHLSSIGEGLHHKASTSSLRPVVSRTPSLKHGGFPSGFGSASACSSVAPSPIISALGEVTPLPSPLLPQDSPGPWPRRSDRPPSRDNNNSHTMPAGPDTILVSSSGETIASALKHAQQRRVLAGLTPDGVAGGQKEREGEQKGGKGSSSNTGGGGGGGQQEHIRNRSLSHYIPDPTGASQRDTAQLGGELSAGGESHIRRELNLAGSRGLTSTKPPTPPPSDKEPEAESAAPSRGRDEGPKPPSTEIFEALGRYDEKKRRWRAVKFLGEGTFSRVMLATSQTGVEEDDESAMVLDDDHPTTTATAEEEPPLSPTSAGAAKKRTSLDRKTLVAVKVCEHGPKGGASEQRIEMSLKRELEIMKSIKHPSLVHLKAWNIEPSRAILVLSFCPGGDLFDVATRHRKALVPSLVRRMFSELVGAVRYLHGQHIVHRDIKLENVLVNLPPAELDASTDWTRYQHSIITLTDLGLSRRVSSADERLETRCGSEDYAAPEVIMGQPYDGRATDAWSLGVLLYALLEARLPFDPPMTAEEAAAAGNSQDYARMRSRTSHRIARVEWRWAEYAGDDTDHDGDLAKFGAKRLLGALEITEGLLKRARSRWTLDKVGEHEWVKGAILEPLVFREEEEGEEVV